IELLKGNGPGAIAPAEYGLGAADLALNRLAAARQDFTNASAHFAEAANADHVAVAAALPALARTELTLRHPDTAFDVARRAEEIDRVEARSNIRSLPEHAGLRIVATRHDALDMMLAMASGLLAHEPRADSLTLDALGRS